MRQGLIVWVVVLLGLGQIACAGGAARPVESGAIVLLDAGSGRQLAHLSANGAVVSAVADGRGAWFVGGSFTRLGGQGRVALARLLPSGAVDPAGSGGSRESAERGRRGWPLSCRGALGG
jgi:uncharacterized protein YjlB